jgi:hypothetical protein
MGRMETVPGPRGTSHAGLTWVLGVLAVVVLEATGAALEASRAAQVADLAVWAAEDKEAGSDLKCL